jgi:hypothetical protein
VYFFYCDYNAAIPVMTGHFRRHNWMGDALACSVNGEFETLLLTAQVSYVAATSF